MFSRKKIQDIYTREYLKRQRLLAKRHRRYMRMRDFEKRKENKKRKVSGRKKIKLFVSTLGIIFFSFWFFLREFFLRMKTRFSIIGIDFRYYLKKVWYSLKNFVYKRTTNLKHSMKKKSKIKKPKKRIPSVKEKRKKSGWRFIKRFIVFCIVVFFVSVGLFLLWFSTLEIPSVQNFENRKISNSTKIYDRTGEILLYDIHENIRRTVVDFDEISQSAKDAIVAIEDHNFYNHNGVVLKSTIRGIFQTIMFKLGFRSGGTVGGSTLTQQVVKNTLLNRDKAISRKVKEWVLAYKIERKLSKDEILEIYLNEAPYGGAIYGIEEASRQFFGIAASDLSIAQSAYLASIPNLPTFYSPYGPNKDKLDDRQRVVLREMKRYGFISDEQYREALEEEVEFIPEEESFAKSLHFVQFVRAQLEETYGTDIVQNGGLSVITTLDYELQQEAEKIIKEHIEQVEEEFDASNAGLIAIEAETGHIIAMVGSRDYFDTEEFDGNFNVTTALRQPGSAFKPIAYVTAFEKGYLPESTIFDTETQFNVRCEPEDTTSEDGCYSPNNYDFKFKGPITFRNALAQSRNIPAIKVNYLAGLSSVIEKARQMGISSLTKSPSFYGLGLVLGGGEVSLLEMTSAYTVFANDGVYNKPTGILEVTDINGNILEKYVPDEERVIEANAARMVNSILSDNVARTPLFGSQSFLYFGERDVAGKTGTTNDNRDAWLIGYTPTVAVGVWTGNNDNSPMKKGSSISGKPWRKFMDEVLKKYENKSFEEYDLPGDFDSLPNMIRGDWYGGTTIYIDKVSGKLATEYTPEETKLAVPQPEPHTILHWIDKDNPRVLNTSRNDPQYSNWEYSVRKFVETNLSQILDINIELPTEYDDVHGPEGTEISFEGFDISGVDEEEVYPVDEVLKIRIKNVDWDTDDISQAQLFINNAFIESDESHPFSFSFVPEELPYFEENNLIRIILTHESGEKISQEKSFTLEF